ncbi:NF038122 family metalloprotease [Leptolyngbya sp. AN03gr2]|uniref:NF038122 family metalloprotease n=1 Tax=unclassified Leptolyngbya TaxID=2650499 RepID=UPI003D3119DF
MATFNFTYAPGTTLQQMIGFEMAGRIWDAHLNDPITVNIHVGVSSSLPANAIGGALPGMRSAQNYSDVVRSLGADRTSVEDWIAVPRLQTKSEYEAWFDAFDPKNGKNNGRKVKTKTLNITRANAKALNLVSGSTELDGVIVFGALQGSTFRWNYDYTRTSAAPTNTLDFLSTAMHEIGHILGFVSGVDKPGWLSSVPADKAASEEYKQSLERRISYTTPMDLFRYSTLGNGRNDLSYGTVGGRKFFSIDGTMPLAEFATGADQMLGGDGFQGSHWKNTTTRTGIMAPALRPEERSWMTDTDLRALDVIGWDIRWRPTINLSTLRSQAEATLAQRIGVSTTWLNQNLSLAEQRLVSDRALDVERMIQNSQVYPWATRSPGTPPPPPSRQVLDLMEQRVAYSSFGTLDDEVSPAPRPSSSGRRGSARSDWSSIAPIGRSAPRINPTSSSFDLSLFAPRTREIAEMRRIAPASLQNWFDQLGSSIRRSSNNFVRNTAQTSQDSGKFTDFSEIVNWTDL